MIGADTNIVLRYFLGDDRIQSPQARNLIEARCSPEQPLYINQLVILEIAAVLEQRRKAPKPEILSFFRAMIGHPHLRIEKLNTLALAMDMFSRARVNFADCLIFCANRDAGASQTFTFDKDAASPGMMTLLE